MDDELFMGSTDQPGGVDQDTTVSGGGFAAAV